MGFSERDLEGLLGIGRQIGPAFERAHAAVKSLVESDAPGRKAYEKTHWGDRGEGRTFEVDAPDPRTGLTAMGELIAIEYRTKKGTKGSKRDIYRHVFEGGVGYRPILSFTYDERPSGLVIVRGRSDYDVTAHGIEG
jgi:hypothetical protein